MTPTALTESTCFDVTIEGGVAHIQM